MDYAIALVYAWLLENPSYYCSWVNAYTQLRYCPDAKRLVSQWVGGHWRRRAEWARVLPALRCVCKFDHCLVNPTRLGTPVRAVRQRKDEEGLIPRRYRVTVYC